jgi:hypothetical protein
MIDPKLYHAWSQSWHFFCEVEIQDGHHPQDVVFNIGPHGNKSAAAPFYSHRRKLSMLEFKYFEI